MESQTSITATSFQTGFEPSNVKKRQVPFTWRSAGYFEITTSNQNIDFREAGIGPTLTAVIPVGNYTVAQLETEIALQMDAVSGVAASYTASFSTSTGLWTIETDYTFLNLLTNTGPSVASSLLDLLGFDTSADYTGDTVYTGSNIALHTSERLIVDLGTPDDDVDTIALFWPYNWDKFSDSAVVKIKANPTAGGWDSPAFEQTITKSTVFPNSITVLSAVETYRYWAIEIVDPENANLYVELGKVCIGLSTDLSRGPDIGFEEITQDLSGARTTPYGQRYYQTLPNVREFSFQLSTLDYTQLTTLEDIYNSVGTSEPIVVIVDKDGSIFDTDRVSVYGHLQGNFRVKHVISNLHDTELTLIEAL
jgi:hypothetical protein